MERGVRQRTAAHKLESIDGLPQPRPRINVVNTGTKHESGLPPATIYDRVYCPVTRYFRPAKEESARDRA